MSARFCKWHGRPARGLEMWHGRPARVGNMGETPMPRRIMGETPMPPRTTGRTPVPPQTRFAR